MKKESIRNLVFNSAWQITEAEGMAKLNVRKVANLSGCSLGSVYNAFENFDDLQFHLRAKILTMLYSDLTEVTREGIEEDRPLQSILKKLGLTYLHFGEKHLTLWKSLFESFPASPVPDWYKNHANQGVMAISEELAKHFDMSTDESKRIVGFFWTAMQGLSSNLLNHKVEVVSDLFQENYLNDYLDYCIEGLLEKAST